ncbi:MAG: hypothetical protein MK080_09485 [Opitutales bacterium]|nr:hypothetical protein [Opitutales bacterium]
MNYALVRSLDLRYFRFIGGGSRYQADPLIEVQQQIKDALWQIRNEVPYSSRDKGALFEDLSSISTSQDNNMSELERISARVRDFERQEILSLANEAMVATSEVVTHALSVAESDNGSIKDVVEQAHDRAGEALRALLKIAPDSVLLTEGQPGEDAPERTLADAGAGELDLDLTPSDDTYANETLAEMELSEAERETLAFLNRLRELARRQQQINQGLQRFTENLANAANESERDRLREELKRLADEQRTLENEAGQIAQDSAQEAASGEVSENLAGTSDGPESGHSSDASTSAQDALNAMESSMRVAAEALEQGDLETAQKAGESASSEVERLESEMSDVAAEALTQSLVGAREEMDRLMRRQQEIGRKIADGESEIGSNLQGFELELVHDLVDQARRIDALMSKMDALALDAVRSNPVLARHIDAMLVRSMRMPIAASLEDASEALERGQFGSGSFFEMEARESMAALKESLDKAVASALGEELSSLELARSELDQLSEELREGLAGEASETSDHASSAASEAFNQDMSSGVGVGSGRFSNSDDWGERLRIVEELINDERSRSQVREAREVMETLFAEASRDDTMPQWDLLRQLVFSPLREVRYQLDGRIREIEGGSALLAPVVENPIPEAYGDRVKAYFERLGRE